MGEANRRRHNIVMGGINRIEQMLTERLPQPAVTLLATQDEITEDKGTITFWKDKYDTLSMDFHKLEREREELATGCSKLKEENNVLAQYKYAYDEIWANMKESLNFTETPEAQVLGLVGGDNKFRFLNNLVMGFVKDGAADIYMRHATFWMREYNMRTTEWIRLTVELQQANGRVTEANRQLNVLSTEEAKHIRAEQILREENETLRSQFDRKDERQEQLGRELALAQESNEALQAKILRLQSVARRAKAARAARKVPGKASR